MNAVNKITKYLLSAVSVAVLAMALQIGSVKAADEAKNYGNVSEDAPNSMHRLLKRVQGTVVGLEADGPCTNIIVRPTNVAEGDVANYVKLRICSTASDETQDKGGWGCPVCANCYEICLANLEEAMDLGIKVRFYTLTDSDNGFQYIQGFQDDPNDPSTCHCFDILGR